MYSIDALTTDLAEIPWTTDATIVRRKSRDHFVISPLLRGELAGNLADIVISPRTKAEVARVIAAAVKHRVPVTPRGGGTANYGQSVPLHGGILLDMVEYRQIISIGDGVIRAEAGANMLAMDIAARETGWEMRLHPSTIATSTIAGFIAGGSKS
jgi:FAD/FMN-containing dehydrogenase